MVGDGSQQYRFNCYLSYFKSNVNSFSTSLSKYLDDPYQFVKELARASNGSVVDGSCASSSESNRKRSFCKLMYNVVLHLYIEV